MRMYRQGLGDCFLLTFQRPNKSDFNMMIDCGLFQNTPGENDTMKKVVGNIEAETNGRLDVVALTHEHWDHISGFSKKQAREIFDRITFEEVWLAWCDDESNPKHKKVQERFKKQIKGLQAALQLMKPNRMNGLRKTVESLVNEFFPPDVLGAKGDGRSEAWQYVVQKKNPDGNDADNIYCSPGTIQQLKGLPEDLVRVFILGPPADIELFNDKEPKKEDTFREHNGHAFGLSHSFLAAASKQKGDSEVDYFTPFEPTHSISEKEAANHPEFGEFFSKHYGFNNKAPDEWRRIDDDWLAMAGELALHLDSFTNNTCLAFAIELVESGKVLLFPGDAQFGNWISWQSLKWKIEDKDGKEITVTAKDLLERCVFYKVGHHGSHNATLKKNGLEMMDSPELVAMIPTNREFAGKKRPPKDGWKMPEPALMDRLEQKARGRVILADEIDAANLDKRCRSLLPASKRKEFMSNVVFSSENFNGASSPLYVEYTIEG